MNYLEKLNRLTDDDFFTFFSLMNAEPRWVTSAGKKSLQLLGICHRGHSHSVVFDPSTRKGTCYSECGGGFTLETWVKRVLNLEDTNEAKDFIENWIDNQHLDLNGRPIRDIAEVIYQDRPFKVEEIEPLPGIDPKIKDELYRQFLYDDNTLKRLVWHTKDHIDVEWLRQFEVAYRPEKKTIILPHHNINGEIVGFYERNFMPLRREIKAQYPDMDYRTLCKFPRAKYVPLLKEDKYITEDDNKISWSFSNIRNLYGLHLAKDAIKTTGKAIIFEGAKSVMLAHQYGYPYAVATHTFGANVNHISMLINCGAKEIIFAFDKQYQQVNDADREWRLYEKKTRELAEKIGQFVNVSRVVDYFEDNETAILKYKDAPIDQGKDNFEKLFANREPLIIDGKTQDSRIRLKEINKRCSILMAISRKKIEHSDPIIIDPATGYERLIYV